MNRRTLFKQLLGSVAGWSAINTKAKPKQPTKYLPGKWNCRILTTKNGVTYCRSLNDEGNLIEKIIQN